MLHCWLPLLYALTADGFGLLILSHAKHHGFSWVIPLPGTVCTSIGTAFASPNMSTPATNGLVQVTFTFQGATMESLIPCLFVCAATVLVGITLQFVVNLLLRVIDR